MSESYSALDGLYALHDELGSGGFGKVKLATHILTGQKVAIKIIDKKAIGDDLPRVKTELTALRELQHQNICRLYHELETEDKFFLVMEYCSGGEMFDYIVKKARLEESEARHFFRQLVQAIAYIHNKGYAHRDLKPENLLLTEDLHLKVIDFGLCARPDALSSPLETCCGSPAYAAPELIQGSPYLGNAADVWSMGVLLYALLVGSLPFEDDSMQGLYKKIMRGNYPIPDWLTPCSRQLLSRMLQVKPQDRISVNDLLTHPWLNKNYTLQIKWKSIFDKEFVDQDVAHEMAFHWRMPALMMIGKIKEWKFDYLTATYFVLLNMKMRKAPYQLPGPPATSRDVCNVINSPTIHASLENNLDRSTEEEEETDSQREVRFKLPRSPEYTKQSQSYGKAILTMPSVMTGRSPQQPRFHAGKEVTPVMGTPAAASRRAKPEKCESAGPPEGNKENRSRGTASCRVRGPLKVTQDEDRPRGVYSTPQRAGIRGLFSPGGTDNRSRARSTDRSSVVSSPLSVSSWNETTGSVDTAASTESERTPRSTTKTPRMKQRMFASLERKTEKVISMLTPRKLRNKTDEPEIIKNDKGMCNLSITSSQNPEKIREELVTVFQKHKFKYELNGWKISARQKDSMGHQMTVELEVVIVESLGFVGIRRKRLNGDAFMYKKVCESILQMAGV